MERTKRVAPGPGQESVWDYPRPPRVEDSARRIRVVFNGVTIADTRRARRVLETSHPPVYYIPPEDVRREFLQPAPHGSFCEWKGQARYYTVRADGREAAQAAWSYADPTPAFAGIRDYVAFYPGKMDACLVDEEAAQPQPGDYYGGWVTAEIVGPFKGASGTSGW